MGAMASCKFPGLDAWKKTVDSNPVAGFIDAILCAWSQIIFCDNSFSGIILMVASFLVMPQVFVGGLVASVVSVIMCKVLKAPAIPVRLGIYSFTSALSGIIMSSLIFPEGMTMRFFVFMALAGVFCTVVTIGCAPVFGKFDASALGLPFGFTALVFMGAAQNMGYVGQGDAVIAHSAVNLTSADLAQFGPGEVFTSTYAGISELLGGWTPVVAILIGVALLCSSRIDFVSSIAGAFIGAATAIYFGCPSTAIMIGLYGYNGMLLMLVLNGRSFKITLRQVILNIIMCMICSIVAAWLAVSFGLVGAVSTAFPFSIICIFMMLAGPSFEALTYYKPAYWGVPETVPAIAAASEAGSATE